jgi:hypothetical protein
MTVSLTLNLLNLLNKTKKIYIMQTCREHKITLANEFYNFSKKLTRI